MSANSKQFFIMKKLIFASVLMLATLTACQNSNDEIENTKTEVLSKDVSLASKSALQAVKSASNPSVYGKPNPYDIGQPAIRCHTDYSSVSGHACVVSGGILFNVSWTDGFGIDPNTGHTYSEIKYTATPVKSCGC